MWDLPPPNPGFEIVIASRGMSKGVAQTDGVQVVPKGFVQFGKLQVGAQWKNITSEVAAGEGAAFVNYTPRVGPLQVTLGASYKFQTGVKGDPDDTSFEFSAGARHDIGRLSLRASAVYSPDDLGSARRSLYFEGGPSLEFDKTLRLSAAIGRRQRVDGIDYTAWNAGVSKTIAGKVTLDARYHDTAQSELGEYFSRRVVVSARLSL